MLADLSIKDFLKQTASDSPVPGGGSVAALCAALGAGLSEMVANLTVGKKGYESAEEEMKKIAKAASACREKLLNDVDRDSDAYNEVMRGFSLPKNTEAEKKKRTEAIQQALKTAALVPLEIAKDALEIMELSRKVVKKGNKNALTDGAVAAMTARTAALAAIYNVKINLKSIRDDIFVRNISEQANQIEAKVRQREKEILSAVAL
jgi:formiminotetrahydrofolate cyclodeaminase